MPFEDKEIALDTETTREATKFFEVSELLYNNDPAGTMCAENDMTTEYDSEAFDIVSLKEDITVDSVKAIFEKNFDDLYDVETIEDIFPSIKRIVLS